jgi:ABC-type nitrate/sulfonate/bicarbonate transport system substrate-binding protein
VSPPPALPLRYANTTLSTTHAPYWIATEAGYFAEEGLDLRVNFIQSSSAAVPALLSGEVDVLSVSGTAPVQAALNGGDTLIVATNVGAINLQIVSAPDLTAPAQLRGQTIGISRFGTIGDTTTRMLLRRLGLEPGADVPLIQVGGQSEGVAALQSGNVRAVTIADLQAGELQERGFFLLYDLADLGLPYVGHTTTTSRRYAGEQPEALRRFVRGLARGMARFVNDKDYSLTVMQKYSGLDSLAVLERSYQLHSQRYAQRSLLTTADGIHTVLEEQGDDARVRAAVPEQFYDNRFVQELHDSGFIPRVYGP